MEALLAFCTPQKTEGILNHLNKIAVFSFILATTLTVHAQHEHHSTAQGDQPSYNDQGLGFEIYTDPNTDFASLPREGVFEGDSVFSAMANNENFDFSYCPEFQTHLAGERASAEFVVFCIARGTEMNPWNLSEHQKMERDGTLDPALDKMPRFGPVILKAGQTLRLINLDSGENALHRLHVFDKPCYHQPRLMTPALYSENDELVAAAYYDCPTPAGLTWDSEKEDGSSSLYNHQTKQPFYLRVLSEDEP